MTSALLAGLPAQRPFRWSSLVLGDTTEVIVEQPERVRHELGARILTVTASDEGEKGTSLILTVRGPSANLPECHVPLGRSRSTGRDHSLRQEAQERRAASSEKPFVGSPAGNQSRPVEQDPRTGMVVLTERVGFASLCGSSQEIRS